MDDAIDGLREGCGPTLSVPEVAEDLGMTEPGACKWLKEGVVPGRKVGGTWCVVTSGRKDGLRHCAGNREGV